MTLKDFREKTKDYDENTKIVVHSSNFELNGNLIDLNYINYSHNYKRVKKQFRDAFDYEYYTRDVYEPNKDYCDPVIVL